LNHPCIFGAAAQLQFAPVAAGFRSAQCGDELRGFVLQCLKSRGNRLLQVPHERFYLGIGPSARGFERACFFVEILERCAERIDQIPDRQFFGFERALCVLRLPAQLLLGEGEK